MHAELARSPVLQKALYLATPDLHAALEKASDALSKTTRVDQERQRLAVARYAIRAAFRPTPFGLFAGCSTIAVGPATHLALAPRGAYRTSTRLDAAMIDEIYAKLLRRPDVRASVSWLTNSSVSGGDAGVHFVTSAQVGGDRKYFLEDIGLTPAILDVMRAASTGKRLDQLVAMLADAETTESDALAFIEELIEAQLLVPDFAPIVTTENVSAALLDDVGRIPSAAATVGQLRNIVSELADIDAQGIESSVERLQACAASLHCIDDVGVIAQPFQVDLFKPAPVATVGTAVVAEAARAAEILFGLALTDDPLASFARRFRDRYEEQWVPLLEALDDEVGIGLDPEELPTGESLGIERGARDREARLAELCRRALENRAPTLRLSEDDLSWLGWRSDRALPDSIAFVGAIDAASSDDVDRGNFRLVTSYCTGPSGASLLGRFTHLDAELRDGVQRYLRLEESAHPEAIFAEVVHVPQGRLGNVVVRPPLREYEIPYLSRSGLPVENQIAPSDLFVAWRDGRLELRSARLGKKVIPRLSSAHNFFDRLHLPVYRFLGMLQRHRLPGNGAWNWGQLELTAKFLPRVEFGRIVLARAQWSLMRDDIEALVAIDLNDCLAFDEWRCARQIPAVVATKDGDVQMMIDFSSSTSRAILQNLVRRRRRLLLRELLPGLEQGAVVGPEGRFNHELVIPLSRISREVDVSPAVAGATIGHNRDDSPLLVPDAPLETRARIARTFVPGSEWLYVKVYCGVTNGDRLLRTTIRAMAEDALRDGIIDRWFFVKYRDPDFHLRLRFHGEPTHLLSALLPRLRREFEVAVEARSIAKVELATYDRELERYGGPEAIEHIEALFHATSDVALELIDLGDANDHEHRIRSAIFAVHTLLEAFERPVQARRDEMGWLGKSEADVRRMWSAWYRANRHHVRDALDAADTRQFASRTRAAVNACLARMRVSAAALLQLERDGFALRSTAEIQRSLAHMCVNRILVAPAGEVERMCYDALSRYYAERVARSRAG
ncbi:MAG TPA: lantibiotic dehydratase [Gemmatimonadaceae bacterium]